jgi:hypothetical protein
VAAATLFVSLVQAGETPSAADAYARVGAAIPLAEFRADSRALPDAWNRASGLASVLAGEEVPARDGSRNARSQMQFQVRAQGGSHVLTEASRPKGSTRPAPRMSDDERAARIAVDLAADPLERIRVVVDGDRGDALAVNGAVADDFASPMDVGPDRARTVFESTLQTLRAHRLLEAAADPGSVRTHRLMQGEQAVAQPAVTRIKEYLFEVPHAVGGIEVFGAATTVSVHRSGQVASIRSLAPAVAPAPTGATTIRAVSVEALSRRAEAENPGARVIPLGLQYPWRATADASLAGHPRQVFQVIPVTQAEGREVAGRAHYVFYSIEDERAAPLVWPRPGAPASGDARPK